VRRPAGILFACFFLSGATGLVYQVVWLRLLTPILGQTVYAITTVLAAFMAGLALGSLLFGRWAPRIRNHVRVYGWLEIGIGLSCVALPWGLTGAARAYLELDRALALSPSAFGVVQFAAVFLLLLVPTSFMGGTLPVLSQALAAGASKPGRAVGALYAVNTFGAVLGVAWAGYAALPAFGNRTTIAIAAAANVLVGLLALGWSRVQQAPPRAADRISVAPTSASPSREVVSRWGAWLTVIALGVSGAVSMIYEVAWTRALALVIGSSTYAFTAMLVAFLTGIAGGSALYSWLWSGRPARPGTLAALQLGIGVAGTGALLVFERMPGLVIAGLGHSMTPGFVNVLHFTVAVLCLLPSTLLIGATFPCAVAVAGRGADRIGGDVGRIYAVNTAGAIAGTMLAGFILVPAMGVNAALRLGMGVNLVLAVVLFIASVPAARPSAWLGVAGSVAVAGALLFIAPWDQRVLIAGPAVYASQYIAAAADGGLSRALRQQGLVFYRDGLSGTVAVQRIGENIFLRVNGKVDASSTGDVPTQLMAGHLPMLAHPNPKRVLVIGLGSGVTVAAVARYPVERIDVVEIEPAIVEASAFFSELNRSVLADPRVRLTIGDARNFLLTTRERYDVIVSEPSNPWISGLASLFTIEFFDLARAHLRPGGTMSQWIHVYRLLPDDIRLVVRTFRTVFPATSMWQPVRSDILLLGRTGPGDRSPPGSLDIGAVRAHFESSAGVRADLARSGIGGWPGLFGFFALSEADAARFADGAGLHTDDRLQLEFTAPRAMYLDTRDANVAELKRYRIEKSPEMSGAAPADIGTAEARYWIGQALIRRRDFVGAAAEYEHALEKNPGHALSLVALSGVRSELGRPVEALALARRVLVRHPGDAGAMLAAGIALARLGRRGEALDVLERGAALDPGDARLRDTIAAVRAGP
jgi:spermidine synthase